MLQTAPNLAALAAEAKANFANKFGRPAEIVVAAPGRVNLIGEHIDYCDGFVLPLALERYIVVAAAPNGTKGGRLATTMEEGTVPLDLTVIPEVGSPKWANYVKGVIAGFRNLGHTEIPGFDACFLSSVPVGGGLSSSAAIECATATLLEALLGSELPKKQKALLCQKAEHDFAHVPCGIMDQFASTFAKEDHLVLIDCRSAEPELVPFHAPDLAILVANTKVSHELSDGGYALRRRQTEVGLAATGKSSWRDVTMAELEAARDKMEEVVFRRGRHVVGEIARTIAAATALREGDFQALGPLMAASHDSLRHDFNVSCAELDLLVEIARDLGEDGGVIGARMTGGGFGGSTVTLCKANRAAAIAKSFSRNYQADTGIVPEIFLTRPGKGAHRVF
ncbi:MAG: galactokinase [Verrucomicrobiales bacterium]